MGHRGVKTMLMDGGKVSRHKTAVSGGSSDVALRPQDWTITEQKASSRAIMCAYMIASYSRTSAELIIRRSRRFRNGDCRSCVPLPVRVTGTIEVSLIVVEALCSSGRMSGVCRTPRNVLSISMGFHLHEYVRYIRQNSP